MGAAPAGRGPPAPLRSHGPCPHPATLPPPPARRGPPHQAAAPAPVTRPLPLSVALAAVLAIGTGSAYELVRDRPPSPVFADEFDRTQLDLDRWSSGYQWGCTNETTGERQCYAPEALAIRDGLLVIEADRVRGGASPTARA
jgi:hypothetical protein